MDSFCTPHVFSPCPANQSPLKPCLTPSKNSNTPLRRLLTSPLRCSPRFGAQVSFGLDSSPEEDNNAQQVRTSKRKERDDVTDVDQPRKRSRRTSGCASATKSPARTCDMQSGDVRASWSAFVNASPVARQQGSITSSPVIAQLQRDVSGSAKRKYSPLSALGLKQLCESPLLVTSRRKDVSKENGADNDGQVENSGRGRVYRKAKRSLKLN